MTKQNLPFPEAGVSKPAYDYYDMFAIVLNNKEKYNIVVAGRYQISNKEFETIEKAKNYLKTKPYEILFNLMCFIHEHFSELLDNSNNNTKSGTGQ